MVSISYVLFLFLSHLLTSGSFVATISEKKTGHHSDEDEMLMLSMLKRKYGLEGLVQDPLSSSSLSSSSESDESSSSSILSDDIISLYGPQRQSLQSESSKSSSSAFVQQHKKPDKEEHFLPLNPHQNHRHDPSSSSSSSSPDKRKGSRKKNKAQVGKGKAFKSKSGRFEKSEVEVGSKSESGFDFDDDGRRIYRKEEELQFQQDQPSSSSQTIQGDETYKSHLKNRFEIIDNGNDINPTSSIFPLGESDERRESALGQILHDSPDSSSTPPTAAASSSKGSESKSEIDLSTNKVGESAPKYQQEEAVLLEQLMKGYHRDVRPVRNASNPVVVRVGITLTQIFDMDEKQQVLTTNVWLDQEWIDELLRWDPKDFGGLEVIRIPCARIWLPDIVLYNNADDYTRGYMPSRAMVSYDGNVFWPPPTKFRSTCSVDVTYFPFDDQICNLKLGSWTYNGYQVDVVNRTAGVDLTNYISNGEWELVKAIQKRNVVRYPCCEEPFPDVTITLVIRRKTLYYIYNIVLPCIMLSALTLLVFCLPPDSGEKIALGITVLLAFSVFMLAINESLPETSESIPLIGVYLTIVMAITSVSVIMTVVVLNLHYLGPQVRPVPRWLSCLLPKERTRPGSAIRKKSFLIPVAHREPKSGSLKRPHVFITQWLGKDKGNRREGSGGGGYSIEVPSSDQRLEDMIITKETSPPQPNNENSHMNRKRPHNSSDDTSSEPNTWTSTGSTSNAGLVVVEELLASIKHLIHKQEEVEAQNDMVAEWRLVAQVVDRVLFWLFFIFTFSSSTMILVVLPIYKRNSYGSSQLSLFGDLEDDVVEVMNVDTNNDTDLVL